MKLRKSFFHKFLSFPLLNCLINKFNISFSTLTLYFVKYSSKSFEFINPEEIVSISLKIESGLKPLILNNANLYFLFILF